MADRARHRIVAGYALRERLGEDELRTTYRASLKGRVEHLHVFRGLSDPADQEARHRELRAALSIPAHPQLLRVLSAGREGNTVYATTEPFEGTSLHGWIERWGPGGSPIGAGLWVARQALAALGHLHALPDPGREPQAPALDAVLDVALDVALDVTARPLVLGRVTPRELFVSQAGEVKLDILPGLCRSRPRDGLHAENAAPLGFESPEQILGQALDPRSDLFSVGASLGSLLLGRAALVGSNMFETYQHLIHADARVPRLLSALRPKLQTLVGRALRQDREARYQTAAEFDAAVAHVGAVLGIEVSAAALKAALSEG